MNDADKIIISNLRRNARKNITHIARETNIPVTTIYDRLKKIEKEYILKNLSLLDFDKLGYTFRSNVIVKIGDNKNELIKYLYEHKNVNSLYLLNFGSKLMLETVFRNINEFDEFVLKLNEFNVEMLNVSHISEELKKEMFLSDVKHFD